MDLSNYLNEEFDDLAVKPSTGVPEPIPIGDYLLQLEKGEVTYTTNGQGVLYKARFVVLDGEYSGRFVYAQYNVRNPNQQAQTIGIAEMKALAVACGVAWEEARKETDLLLYKPFMARVGMDSGSTNKETGRVYAPRNRIMKYMPATPEEMKPKYEKPLGGQVGNQVPPKQVMPEHSNQPYDDEVPF